MPQAASNSAYTAWLPSFYKEASVTVARWILELSKTLSTQKK
jgi:hypothetical protein